MTTTALDNKVDCKDPFVLNFQPNRLISYFDDDNVGNVPSSAMILSNGSSENRSSNNNCDHENRLPNLCESGDNIFLHSPLNNNAAVDIFDTPTPEDLLNSNANDPFSPICDQDDRYYQTVENGTRNLRRKHNVSCTDNIGNSMVFLDESKAKKTGASDGRLSHNSPTKMRAKSADFCNGLPSDSSVSTCHCSAHSPAVCDGKFCSASTPRSAASTPSAGLTEMRLVPTCLALRKALLALYRLDDFDLKKIGQGYFSEVFKVRHKVTGDHLVLKLNTNPGNRPNVLFEVQTLRRLKHSNVVRFRGVCVDRGQLHALTEYCNGGTLEQLVLGSQQQQQNGDSPAALQLPTFPWSVRANLAVDIARGMQYVHSCGFVHRDLTAKNVLLKYDKRKEVPCQYTAVIADFGLSCKIPKAGTKLPVVGTPYWMAPECLNEEIYTEKADVFSYGIILCQIIARIDADPDVLPRTKTFGLDYVRFSELCLVGMPLNFLELACRCCLMNPTSRPGFDQIVPSASNLATSVQEHEKEESAVLHRQYSHPTSSITEKLDNNGYLNIQKASRLQMLSHLKLIRCHSDIGINECSSLDDASSSTSTTPNNNTPLRSIHESPVDEEGRWVYFPQQPPLTATANLKLALIMAAHDPLYTPAADGESVNPFAANERYAGRRKILAENCFASPSLLNTLDNCSPSSSQATNLETAVMNLTSLTRRRLTVRKECLHHKRCDTTLGAGCPISSTPIRRAYSLPGASSSPNDGTASVGDEAGTLFVDVNEETPRAIKYPSISDSSDECASGGGPSPNHAQGVRRVTQVFEEQDKLFVETWQKRRKSMKKSITMSSSTEDDTMKNEQENEEKKAGIPSENTDGTAESDDEKMAENDNRPTTTCGNSMCPIL